MKQLHCDTLVIGAGIIGISTAYYLKLLQADIDVVLVDMGQPMAFTSAQSGENYRNWWPHPVMTAFTNRSIDLMEMIVRENGNRINMSRAGYALCTRSSQIEVMLTELYAGYTDNGSNAIRLHDTAPDNSYIPSHQGGWESVPDGVDVLTDAHLIRASFPSFSQEIGAVIHIRRAGSISGQQLGQYMLERFREAGGKRVNGRVSAIEKGGGFDVRLVESDGEVRADRIVNAAGPFANDIAAMLGVRLPIKITIQQKIAFDDTAGAIPRNMPFSIDLDPQIIDWSEAESELIAEDDNLNWLTHEMPGAIHCRPDGGAHGSWIKMGWAFNETESIPTMTPDLFDYFPEIVLRGAARLNPSLKTYYDNLPANLHHYGGYYTTTEENWPLVGKMAVEGTFIVGAMSGFGTMAACAAGELCARHVIDASLPEYAAALSPDRYNDAELMTEVNALSSRGIL